MQCRQTGSTRFANGWQGPRMVKGAKRPLEDRRLSIEQENPKQAGGDAHARYEAIWGLPYYLVISLVRCVESRNSKLQRK